MNLLAQSRPPKWPFLLGDAALLAVAFCIGYFEPAPLSTTALSFIFGCVALGALLAVVPFVVDFNTTQREATADFQHKLEDQNNKLHNAAELLAGAANQLKSAHEAAARSLHLAENLPYRMQEKIAEFTAQLAQSQDEEKAAMAKELEALRKTEGERIAAIAEKIRTATKELLELDKETRPAFDTAGKQYREIEKNLASASTQAQAALVRAAAQMQVALEAAETKVKQSVEQADAKLASRLAEMRAFERDFDLAVQKQLERLKSAAKVGDSSLVSASPEPKGPRKESEKNLAPRPVETPARPEPPAAASGSVVPPPSPPAAGGVPLRIAGLDLAADKHKSASPPSAEATASISNPPAEASDSAGNKSDLSSEIPAAAAATPASAAAAAPPALKREPRRRAKEPVEAGWPGSVDPEIVYDETAGAGVAAPAKTSDGTTRLLVTAYIGIGNKVFIRGAGPGLSWEKGVPMEFVSIGKWSWQSTDATAPFTVQFFKNDEIKALGEPITVPPGHHVEASPAFREPEPF